MARDGAEAQLRTYYSVLNTYGHGAGMEFFSRVVMPFVESIKTDRPLDAYNAARAAQKALRIDPNSQLDMEMQDLLARLKPATQN